MTTPFDVAAGEEGIAAVQAAAVDPEIFLNGCRLEKNDIGNAKRVTHYYGEHLRYIKKMGQWRNWDGRRWNPSTEADIMKVARQIVANIFVEATVAPENIEGLGAHAERSSARNRMTNMMQVAIGDDHLWRDLAEFDANPYLINLANGTVDIRKKRGERIRQHDPFDFLTQIMPHKYNESADCPKWKTLVARVVQNANQDGATLRFLQKALGYSLLGGNMEHMIFFLTGSERCGKSKILEIVRALVSEDYAHISKPDLISKKHNGHHDSEIFSIISKRLVCISEVSSAFNLDESVVKSLTGEPVATARRLRAAEEIQVPATWTIWLATNSNPSVQNWDGAIAERVVVIPCGPTIPPEERIPDLDRQIIEEEAEGVLAWLVEGAHMWWCDLQEAMRTEGIARTGLAKPPSILAAVSSYATDSDYIGAFIDDWLILEEGARVGRTDVFKKFKETRAPGEKPDRNKLYDRIRELNDVYENTAREFVGVRFKTTSSQVFDWETLKSKADDE